MITREVHDIEGIQFGVLSPEDIKNMAVCVINSSKPSGANSVYDERMGAPLYSQEACVTCGKKKECVGHYGCIELAEPVLHPMYYRMITMFLKCFCKQCHRLLLTSDQIELNNLNKLKGEKRFTKILEKIEKIDICGHCSSAQPKIIYKSKDGTIGMEHKKKERGSTGKVGVILNVEDIKKIFDGVIEDDLRLMGLDPENVHPKNFVLTWLIVIPFCSRPYIVSEGNICDDDLTYQYMEIVKINNQLLGDDLNDLKKQKLSNSLKFRIQTLMNNSKGRAKHPTDKRALKGLKERISGKKGRVRGNLMGKRVDFSARTVIGAEPTLRLNQVAIPKEVASIHTKPEIVQEFNKEWLTTLVNTGKANKIITNKNGKNIIINLEHCLKERGTRLMKGDIVVKAGNDAKFVRKGKGFDLSKFDHFVYNGEQDYELVVGDRVIRNNEEIPVKYSQDRQLNIGDVVERKLLDGDAVLFNRYPTLHKGGMLGMEIIVGFPNASENAKINKNDPMTFRFNLAGTATYNADFDGDEMNTHVPQSYEAEAELRYTTTILENIVTAQESKPIVVPKQDTLVAACKMSEEDAVINREQFFDITMCGKTVDGKPLWRTDRIASIWKVLKKFGKDENVFRSRILLSLLFPETLFYENKNSVMEKEPVVKIHQGVLLEGALDKSVLGSAHGSLIQILHKEYGKEIVANFIDNIQFICNAWLMHFGFSVGLEDCMVTSEKSVSTIKNAVTQCYTKAKGIEETTLNEGIREVRVTAALDQAKNIGMKIAKEAMRKDNNFLTTTKSGAKGDYFNIAQITGLLGQQNLECGRVIPTLNHGKRSLPHYTENLSMEQEYESRGFVRNSFIHGLTPQEFHFHAMSGREGVIDTAMGTAKSGYMQRRIVKVFEDVQVQNDYTVRDNNGRVYQMAYNDNFDAKKMVKCNDELVFCDVDRLMNTMNNCEEAGIEYKVLESDEPEVEIKEVSAPILTKKEIQQERKILIQKIKKRDPYANVEDLPLEDLEKYHRNLLLDDLESDNEIEEAEESEVEEDQEVEEDEVEEDELEDDEEDDEDEDEEDVLSEFSEEDMSFDDSAVFED